MRFLGYFGLYLCLLQLVACGNSMADIEQVKVMDKAGIERATNIQMYYSDSAIVRVLVKAPVMLNHLDPENPRREFPNGIKADFFDDSGNLSSKLTAKSATQQEREETVTVRDSVVIWNYRKERLECEELILDRPKDKISSTKYVKITTPENTIWGYGFESNMEFTKWRILEVKGRMRSKNLMDSPL
ncbi:MAG: LPS export ABC transporter periplasmic protein LptC [Saprospiraceae bacterium]|nr:LPS export ABC transporter periplasmic protein LptC [Saprospiraceae bacterium]